MSDEQPTKRQGPLLWLSARSWRFWGVVALLPVLYVASSGPAGMFLIRLSVARGDPIRRLSVDYDYWTPTYAPLVWMATHNDEFNRAWTSYRDLFPYKIYTRP